MSTQPDDTIRLQELNHPEDEQDPRYKRSDDQIRRLKDRLKNDGLVTPIIYTADGKIVVDGNTRVVAQKDLADQSEEYQHLRILGEFEGYVYAVPDHNITLGPEEAAADINYSRENLSQADRAKTLDFLYNLRIVQPGYVARDVEVTAFISQYENYKDADTKSEWEPPDEWAEPNEAIAQMEEIFDILQFNEPETARGYVTEYKKATKEVLDDWSDDLISYSHVEELNNILQHLDDGAEISELDITRADVRDESAVNDYNKFKNIGAYDYGFLREHSHEDEYRYNTNEIYYTRDDLRLISDKLEDALKRDEPGSEEEEEEDEEFQQFKEQLLENHEEEIHKIANNITGKESEDIIQRCYELDQEGEKDVGKELAEAVEDIEELLDQKEQLRDQRVENYSFWNTPFAKRDEHQDVPVVFDDEGEILDDDRGFELDEIEVATFFHDNLLMDMEVPQDNFFHLIFFSPPYFDQSGTMPIEGWLPEDTDEITDEETLDEVYTNFLDWLLERIKLFSEKLKPGRAIIINVSDFSTSSLSQQDTTITTYPEAPDKRYNLPANLSTRIEREVNNLVYDSTIQWHRKSTTSQRGGIYWSESDDDVEAGRRGYPLQYYPQDITEELLIFRKGGKPDQSSVIEEAAARFDKEFVDEDDVDEDEFRNFVRYEDPWNPFQRNLDEIAGNFDNPRRNVWKIEEQDSEDWEHDRAFPWKLARLVIELFTLPGERIADPFAGYATVLREVQDINVRQNGPNRQGFAWENFGSEQVRQEDYREKVHEKLNMRLGLDIMDRLGLERTV